MANPKFDRIIKALNKAGMHATADALDRAADDEAHDLTKGIKAYQLRDGGKKAREAAEDFYAMEIATQVLVPDHPTVDRMLNHRRFPVVWAVAEVIRTNKIQID